MKKKLLSLSVLFLLALVLFSPLKSFAQGQYGPFTSNPCSANYTYNTNTGACEPDTNSNPTSADSNPGGIQGVFVILNNLLNSVLPVLVALGVVYLVWGIVQYVIGDNEEAKKAGRDRIIFGIIGLAVIISVWGLVDIFVKTFNLDTNNKAPSHATLNNLLPQ